LLRPLAPLLACFVTSRVSAEGRSVGFMVRLPVGPREGPELSGWQFLAGDEDQEYVDDPNNVHVTSLNTIANHDPAVIPFLDRPRGTAWARTGHTFIEEPPPW
jgi:hypothetical protein